MDKALNQTLASLPDDTKVFVSQRPPKYRRQTIRQTELTITPAGSRVHQRQRQIRHQGAADGADQEARVVRRRAQADAGQIHHRG